MVGVEQWAEIRRMVLVERRVAAGDPPPDGVGVATRSRGRWRAASRRGMSGRRRGRSWIRSGTGSASSCGPIRGSSRSGCGRWRASLGYEGGKTIFDDYVREVRPRFLAKRTFQRTIYRPGELVQCDLWEPRELIPVGHGQMRRGWVVTAELCWSRVIAGALDLLQGGAGHPVGPGALPVAARRAAGEAGLGSRGRDRAGAAGRREEFAAFCGQLGGRLGDPRARATRRPRERWSARTGSCARTSSRAGASRTTSTSRTSSTRWC